MEFVLHSHHHGLEITRTVSRYRSVFDQITDSITHVTDKAIISHHSSEHKTAKSISATINELLDEEFVKRGWERQSPIFSDSEYNKSGETHWRLDFAKPPFSIEVAFNHGEAIAWNLLKPTLASQLNHVQKKIQTEIGVVIAATAAMKEKGGFDGACGEYEKILRYLKPLSSILTTPMVIIGLKEPRSFYIKHYKQGNRLIGKIQMKRK